MVLGINLGPKRKSKVVKTITEEKTQTAPAMPVDDKKLSAPERSQLAKHEASLKHHFGTFKAAGEALVGIRDGRLYRETHDSFEQYCRGKWDMSKTQANRLIQAAQVVSNLEISTSSKVVERLTEGAIRPLTSLKPATQKKVFQKILDKHPKEITARLVEETAREVAPAETRAARKPTPIKNGKADLIRRSELLEQISAWEKVHKTSNTFAALKPQSVLQQVRRLINNL